MTDYSLYNALKAWVATLAYTTVRSWLVGPS
jgi:hypothetical protein